MNRRHTTSIPSATGPVSARRAGIGALVLAVATATLLTGCTTGATTGTRTASGASGTSRSGDAPDITTTATDPTTDSVATAPDATDADAPGPEADDRHTTAPAPRPAATRRPTPPKPHTPRPHPSATVDTATGHGPSIVSFRVTQKPKCPEGTAVFRSENVPVIISWKLSGATGAALSVDAPDGEAGTYGTYASEGTETFRFSCAGEVGSTETHTYAVYTVGGGEQRSKTLTVSATILNQGKPA